MKDFSEWLVKKDGDMLMKAIETHYRLVTIHPFVDGNGRTARLLLNMPAPARLMVKLARQKNQEK